MKISFWGSGKDMDSAGQCSILRPSEIRQPVRRLKRRLIYFIRNTPP
jgi:hypothetical protein